MASRLQQVDDATLRDAAIQQAQEIRAIPEKLREQGIVLSADQIRMIQGKADELAIQSSQPDFRRKVTRSLKKYGVETLKIVGYAGNAVVSATLAPPLFTVVFLQALFTGHDFDQGTSDDVAQAAAETLGMGYVGIDYLFYVAAGSAALGVMTGSVADLIVSAIICHHHNDASDHSQLGGYCHRNWKLMAAILGGTRNAGVKSGGAVHHGILKIFHAIGHLFHHPKEAPGP